MLRTNSNEGFFRVARCCFNAISSQSYLFHLENLPSFGPWQNYSHIRTVFSFFGVSVQYITFFSSLNSLVQKNSSTIRRLLLGYHQSNCYAYVKMPVYFLSAYHQAIFRPRNNNLHSMWYKKNQITKKNLKKISTKRQVLNVLKWKLYRASDFESKIKLDVSFRIKYFSTCQILKGLSSNVSDCWLFLRKIKLHNKKRFQKITILLILLRENVEICGFCTL